MKIVRIAKYEDYTKEFYSTPAGKEFLASWESWQNFILKYFNWPQEIYLVLASYTLDGEQTSMKFKLESGYLFAIAYIYEEKIDAGEQIKQGNYEILDMQNFPQLVPLIQKYTRFSNDQIKKLVGAFFVIEEIINTTHPY